ncbi:hypothetical protein BJV82DRAFT_592430 [Fennellomyces sp. T-0311]|nr:hypothetical protein BJV82DRAFT_592430 [Fennellomyces sp. T-0311]
MSSSPNESISDFDDAASTKKRGRDQSAEPHDQPVDDSQKGSQDDKETSVPKKSKRDDEEDIEPASATSVRTIRRNLKDMSTADKSSPPPSEDDSGSEDATMDKPEENNVDEKREEPKTKHAFAAFGGNHDDDDWSEFAEEETDSKKKDPSEKPKYTFGATSGFGTKGWSSHQTSTPPVAQTTQKPTFGGFSGSAFGGFGASQSPSTSTATSAPTFGSFQASSFALAAASSTANALASPQKEANEISTTTDDESSTQASATHTPEPTDHTKNRPKLQTEVITGEEDENTLYQTKAKLYEMDGTTGSWKERGVGTLRIKEHKEDTLRRRVVMRADSVYRLILNIRLVSWLKFDIMQEKFVQFGAIEMGATEDGKSEKRFRKFALKVWVHARACASFHANNGFLRWQMPLRHKTCWIS